MSSGERDDDLDARDSVWDALLREAVGAEVAPDLVARVESRLADTGRGARKRKWVGGLLGTVLGVAAALTVMAFAGRRQDSRRHLVAWQVADGCLAWQGRDGSATAHRPARALWPIAEGDHLRTCDQGSTTCDVGGLGRLHMTTGTEIEVRTMEWKSFTGGTALGAVTVAVVYGAIAWSGGGDPVQAGTGESLELRAQAPNLAAAKVDDMQRQLDELQGELRAAKKRAEEAEAQAARTVAARAESSPPVGDADASVPLKHAFTYAGMEAVLASIDWGVTGKCMHEMTQKLDALMAALDKGEDLPLDVLGEIQQLNAELIKQAGALMKADVPGTGPNGVFTNPVVVANQIHATLAKAGIPLSNAQEDAMRSLSAQIAGEDEQRRSGLDADGFDLEEILGETGLKDRLYQQARQLLTPEQARVLFPERLAGTASNLFDSGLVWAQFAKPLEVRDRGDFAAKVSDSVIAHIGLTGAADAQVRAAVTTWAQSFPDDAFAASGDRSLPGLGKLGPVRAAAVRQLALLRELERTVPLTAEQKRKLRQAGPVYLPHRR